MDWMARSRNLEMRVQTWNFMTITDSKCYELAASFLSDHPEKDTIKNREILAQHIQEQIEEMIEFTLQEKNPI